MKSLRIISQKSIFYYTNKNQYCPFFAGAAPKRTRPPCGGRAALIAKDLLPPHNITQDTLRDLKRIKNHYLPKTALAGLLGRCQADYT